MKTIEFADVRVDTTITRDMIDRAMRVLVDNGIEEDEAETVMQALGYALLDKELFETKTEENK